MTQGGLLRPLLDRRLWLGHAGDLRDPRSILAAGIEAVVELADNEAPASLPRDLIHWSPCIAAAALARARGRPLAETLALIAQANPVDVSPALFAQVQAAI